MKKEKTMPWSSWHKKLSSPRISIFCCCATGLGSSLMLKMTVEEALDILGLTNTDLAFGQASAVPLTADLVICSDELAPNLHILQDVRGMHDLMDEQEAVRLLSDWLRERESCAG